jgi:hypothetical protein
LHSSQILPHPHLSSTNVSHIKKGLNTVRENYNSTNPTTNTNSPNLPAINRGQKKFLSLKESTSFYKRKNTNTNKSNDFSSIKSSKKVSSNEKNQSNMTFHKEKSLRDSFLSNGNISSNSKSGYNMLIFQPNVSTFKSNNYLSQKNDNIIVMSSPRNKALAQSVHISAKTDVSTLLSQGQYQTSILNKKKVSNIKN